MGRPKGSVNRKDRGEVEFPESEEKRLEARRRIMDELRSVDREVLDGMSKTNRMRLTHVDGESLTLRQKQAAGAEYLAAVVGHPEYRLRLLEEAIKDPVSVLKIASSERPKEIHLEAEIQHSVVVVPSQMSALEWNEQVKTIEGEAIKEDW